MAISIDMRVLARKLEKSSDELLANAAAKGPDVLDKVSTAIVAASTLLEQVADDMDENASFSITPDQLNEIAALASAFDESKDPLLKKQASVLDELLLSIASPKNAVAMTRKATEDEVNRLREERRKARREEAYEAPRKAHAEMNNAEAVAKAVEQQVKRYIPLEAPLQTRYPPDRPGGQMTRITDHVYQDIDTGIIYDYKAGYTTQKGNKIPGGSVENQTRQLGDYRNQGSSLFETRESLMGRYAAGGDLHHLKKYAMHNEIAQALKAVRDNTHKLGLGPKILEKAIDLAGQDGLSTSEIGEILGDVASAEEDFDKASASSFLRYMDEFDAETARNYFPTERAPEKVDEFEPPTEEEFQRACNLLNSLKSAGWHGLAEDVFSSFWASHDGPDAVRSGSKSPGVQKVYDICMTGLTPEQAQETRGRETIPIGGSSGDTFIPQRDTITAQPVTEIMGAKKESLIALALSAVQELAPHLLSTAVDKAIEGGLNKAQINYVLGSKPKFKAASLDENSEINIAKSLFAHLKALGWDDLIDSHLEVMGTLGVSKEAIQKLAGEFTDSKASLKHLNFLLKAGGVAEFAPEFFGTEDDAPPPGLMDDKPSPKAKAPMFGTESSPPPPGLMGDVPVVEDWGLPEPPSGPITPKEDLVEWTKTFDEAKRAVFSKAVLAKINELQIEGETEKAKELVGKAAQAVNERMNAAGFVGAYENDASGKRYLDIAKILKGAPAQAPETVTTVGTGEGAVNTSAVKWGDYQKQHGVFISKEVAEKLENRIKLAWDEAKESYDSVFSKFKFEGKELPSSVRKLPKEIFEELMEMKGIGDSTEAMKVVLPQLLTKYFVPRSEDLAQKREQQLREKAEAKMAEAEAAEADGKAGKAKSLLEHAARIEAEINDKDKLAADAVQEEVNKWMPTEMDLKVVHAAMFGPQRLSQAKAVQRKVYSDLFRISVNDALKEAGLPTAFAVAEAPSIESFTEQLKELGSVRLEPGAVKPKNLKPGELMTPKPKRGELIHPYDKNLKPIWKSPKEYVAALEDIKARNPLRKIYVQQGKYKKQDPETKAKWDAEMKARGFVPPGDKLFGGYANTHFMLYNPGKKGEKRNPLANPLANFKGLKNIFENPQEYVEKYLEGRDKFKTEWREKPKQFKQIYGAPPRITGVPDGVVKKILKMKAADVNEKDAAAEVGALGIPASVVKALYEYARDSGHKIRSTITAMTLGGKSLDEIQEELGTRFAGAYIPETLDKEGRGVIEVVYDNILKDQADQARANAAFNAWMEKQGYYPPHKVAIGEKTTAELLGGGSYKPVGAPDQVGGWDIETEQG
jgi:hypothetical protein